MQISFFRFFSKVTGSWQNLLAEGVDGASYRSWQATMDRAFVNEEKTYIYYNPVRNQ